MKFILLVEGDADHRALPEFLKRWLDPKLAQPVGVKSIKHGGWPDLVRDLPIRAKLHAADADVIAVIGLLDLYGPTVYPANKTTVAERYSWFKSDLEAKANQVKFRQFFAIHELEAWLLSDPAIFPTVVEKALPQKAPEQVNFNKPPKALLKSLYWSKAKKHFKETTDTVDLFLRLDPQLSYTRCPSLKALLDEMLALARAAGL